MKARHLISIRDLTAADVAEIFDLAAEIKRAPAAHRAALAGASLGMIFQEPSTRTRVSFEVGIYQLGGIGLYLSGEDLQLTRGETMADTAGVLSRYVDGIVARVRAHADLVELSRHATIPVVNGLSDLLHPCQALADYFTLREKKGDLRGRKIAYVGDGNNICHSLLFGANKVGMSIAVATPPGREPKSIILKSAQREAAQVGARIAVGHDPAEAVAGADAVYTSAPAPDAEPGAFEAYRVDAALLAKAKPDALFLHCLPAQRGREVAAEVIDGPQSVVFDQAENRLHVQKAILRLLVRGPGA